MSALDRATADETERPPDPSAFGVYYARLQHQQNMLQDVVRTDTYRRAIVGNADDFRGKVVLDVGAGTGMTVGVGVGARLGTGVGVGIGTGVG